MGLQAGPTVGCGACGVQCHWSGAADRDAGELAEQMRLASLRTGAWSQLVAIAVSGWNAHLRWLAHLRERIPVFADRVPTGVGHNRTRGVPGTLSLEGATPVHSARRNGAVLPTVRLCPKTVCSSLSQPPTVEALGYRTGHGNTLRHRSIAHRGGARHRHRPAWQASRTSGGGNGCGSTGRLERTGGPGRGPRIRVDREPCWDKSRPKPWFNSRPNCRAAANCRTGRGCRTSGG